VSDERRRPMKPPRARLYGVCRRAAAVGGRLCQRAAYVFDT
jgi:hypothetical protein